jgi:hypothetical protein
LVKLPDTLDGQAAVAPLSLEIVNGRGLTPADAWMPEELRKRVDAARAAT